MTYRMSHKICRRFCCICALICRGYIICSCHFVSHVCLYIRRGGSLGYGKRMVATIRVTSKWTRWCLKSPASRLFAQPFIQVQITENIKAQRHWPFLRGIHRWPVNFPHKWPVTRKMFAFDGVIMPVLVKKLWWTWINRMDHSGYGISQWEMRVDCSVFFHWLSPELSL